MRSIIRFSIDGEQNGQLRNLLAAILTNARYTLNPHVTATWEHPNITPQHLAHVMQEFWRQAGNPPNEAHIDHVWMYSDNPSSFGGASGATPTGALTLRS